MGDLSNVGGVGGVLHDRSSECDGREETRHGRDQARGRREGLHLGQDPRQVVQGLELLGGGRRGL